MKKVLFLLCAVTSLAACDGRIVRKDFISSECFDGGAPRSLSAFTVTAVHYGDSRMMVIPVSKISSNSEFRLRLIPDRHDTDLFSWKDALIEISSDDDDADTPPNWLSVSGTYHDSDDHWLVACVPDFEDGRQIKFKVSVSHGGQELGMLDPRADIIPN